MGERQAAFDRILELGVTADESLDQIRVDTVTFFRNRQSLNDGNGYTPGFSGGAFADPVEVELGQTIPTPSVIRIDSTFQA